MASSRPHTAFSTQPRTAYPTKTRHSRLDTHVVVVTWENVLFPMSWMGQHLGLSSSVASIRLAHQSQLQSPELSAAIAALEEQAMALLYQAEKCAHGPVCIVSDNTTAYVELVSSVFFPRLTHALRQISSGLYVLGKPDTQLSELELSHWKANLLRTVLCERVLGDYNRHDALQVLKRPASGCIGVLALYVSQADALAASSLVSVAPYVVLKCIHGQPELLGLDNFYAQLQKLAGLVKDAVASDKPLRFAF